MSGYYSLDPTGINAAYQEQKYRQEADDYRVLRSVKVTNQEAGNEPAANGFLQILESFIEYILFTKRNSVAKTRL
jgi:hypothetical protein